MIERNTVQNFYDFLDEVAPFASQMPWDNSGLLIGDRESTVRVCVLTMDMTAEVIRYAESIGAELIITHHPVIFNPIKKVTSDSLVYRLIRAGISVISAHTNLDLAMGGVNDALAERLQLKNIRLFENADAIGRIGDLEKEMTAAEFAAHTKACLGETADVAFVGENMVHTVAMVGGAGSDYITDALKAGADAYVTGEVKHHEWMMAQDLPITLVSAGHHATETMVFDGLAEKLAARFPETKFLPFESCRVRSI